MSSLTLPVDEVRHQPKSKKRKKVVIAEEDDIRHSKIQVSEYDAKYASNDDDEKDITMPFRDKDRDAAASAFEQIRSDMSALLGSSSSSAPQTAPPDPEPIEMPKERGVRLQLNPYEGRDDEEQEQSPDPDYCFFCYCSSTNSDLTKNVLYSELRDFIEVHFGAWKDIAWVMDTAQALYNLGIRKETSRNLPFYRRVMFEHFLSHVNDGRFHLERTLMAFSGLKRFMEDNELIKASVSNPSIKHMNYPALDRYLKICEYADKTHDKVMKYRIQRMAQTS